MRWSWKMGRFAGINTYVHSTFLLLIAWAAWGAYKGAGTALAVALGVGFLLAVFGSVLLHEFGHALVARRYGINTRRIILSPIGGIAQLEGMPARPSQELAVALAGPAVNFVLAAGLWVFGELSPQPLLYGFAESLMWANLTLAVFNLLPAFPMDGGRALRALLSLRMGDHRATQTAAFVGKSIALVMAVVGFFFNWTLIAVAAFVWYAAGREVAAARDEMRFGLHPQPAPQWRWTRRWSRAASAPMIWRQRNGPEPATRHVVFVTTRY